MVKQSDILNQIEHFNVFLWELVDHDRASYLQRIEQLRDLNKLGEYEKFMKDKWDIIEWWIPAGIIYNELTMERIRSKKFRPSQLKKMQANSTQKKKTAKGKPKHFKTLLVESWFSYCSQHGIDPRLFEEAQEDNIDYDI